MGASSTVAISFSFKTGVSPTAGSFVPVVKDVATVDCEILREVSRALLLTRFDSDGVGALGNEYVPYSFCAKAGCVLEKLDGEEGREMRSLTITGLSSELTFDIGRVIIRTSQNAGFRFRNRVFKQYYVTQHMLHFKITGIGNLLLQDIHTFTITNFRAFRRMSRT